MVGTRDVAAAMARTEMGWGETVPFPEWLAGQSNVRVGTFSEAAAHGEVLMNATHGAASLDALAAAGADNLAGTILMDVTNPLDFSRGTPRLFVANDDSLAEQIQRAFPEVRVVKTLNTVTAALMVDPGRLGDGEHHMFVAGNDEAARQVVTRLLQEWFGWRLVIDLGDIVGARAMEMYLAMWVRLYSAIGTAMANVRVVTES
jgi:predicted dinucleotide-binding enzyme